MSGHGLLESRTIKNEKTDALISERIDEITYFFFERKVYYSAIDVGSFRYLKKKIRAGYRAGPELGNKLKTSNQVHSR